ncbi:MAG: preprotein translocase subunit SecG [Oscillospiraceae bacterium]|jgi:preprotein translocase subunit SecG|nr:preprotein translocase subunit SecG [Oscillospiraceae bacterium]
MQAIKVLATVLLVISSLVVIISVLLQPGETSGLGAIAGGAETFFGKNKAKSYEGKLALATKVAAGVFLCMSLVIAAIH